METSKDFPAGIVEGFYGPPWSHLDRLYMIRFLSDVGFNTYMYAPKDDEYHRAEWRKDYPESLSLKLKELVQACNLYSVKFVFTVSPGLSIVYSDKNELESLIRKLRHVIGMGCDWVGILLDDIDQKLVNEADRKNFKNLAAAHAYLINTALDELRKQNKNLRVTFCPTYYANDYLEKKVSDNEYLSEIGSELVADVDVLWTGKHVVSTTITREDADEFGKVVRRKPLLWDNYPVNDYFRGNEPPRLRLNMGPFRGRSKDLTEYIAGFLSNPMNESEASKLPLLTLTDYIRDPQNYSADKSFETAIDHLYSGERSYPQLRALIHASEASALDWHEAGDLRETVDNLISTFEQRSTVDTLVVRKVRLQLGLYSTIGMSLASGMRNRKLHSELQQIIPKLEKLGRLGLICLDALEELGSGGVTDKTLKKLRDAGEAVSKDRTQVLGQVDFGWMLEERKESALHEAGLNEADEGTVEELLSGLGLPKVRSDSPIVSLYKIVTSKIQTN